MMSVDNQAIKAHAQNNLSKLPIAGVQASPAKLALPLKTYGAIFV